MPHHVHGPGNAEVSTLKRHQQPLDGRPLQPLLKYEVSPLDGLIQNISITRCTLAEIVYKADSGWALCCC